MMIKIVRFDMIKNNNMTFDTNTIYIWLGNIPEML